MKQYRKIISLCAVGLLLLSCTACSRNASQRASSDQAPSASVDTSEVYFGCILPMTGKYSLYAADYSKGISVALDMVNVNGGLFGSRRVRFSCIDDAGDEKKALAGYDTLQGEGKKDLYFAGVTGAPASAVASRVQSDGILGVGLTGVPADLVGVGTNLFSSRPTDTFLCEVLANDVSNRLSSGGRAVLLSAEGQTIAPQFEAAALRLGFEVQTVRYEADEQLQQAVADARGAKVVLALDSDEQAVAVQAILDGLTGAAPALVSRGTFSQSIASYSAAQGRAFLETLTDETVKEQLQAFSVRYDAKYKQAPNIYALFGFDICRFLLEAVNFAGSLEPAAIADALPKVTLAPIAATVCYVG